MILEILSRKKGLKELRKKLVSFIEQKFHSEIAEEGWEIYDYDIEFYLRMDGLVQIYYDGHCEKEMHLDDFLKWYECL